MMTLLAIFVIFLSTLLHHQNLRVPQESKSFLLSLAAFMPIVAAKPAQVGITALPELY